MCTQEARDQKYLHSFFGKDFIDELYQIDSEFLKTGNKLLGLHSMDTTSLASALFVLSLAKNDVRAEILNEFLRLLRCDLPREEANYYVAGLLPAKTGARRTCEKKFYLLANNAKFQSFLGFFNADVVGADTMNPAQREFVRLAQIFKARLITELQLRQRVVERPYWRSGSGRPTDQAGGGPDPGGGGEQGPAGRPDRGRERPTRGGHPVPEPVRGVRRHRPAVRGAEHRHPEQLLRGREERRGLPDGGRGRPKALVDNGVAVEDVPALLALDLTKPVANPPTSVQPFLTDAQSLARLRGAQAKAVSDQNALKEAESQVTQLQTKLGARGRSLRRMTRA